jgi:type VI secretion system protein ImpH
MASESWQGLFNLIRLLREKKPRADFFQFLREVQRHADFYGSPQIRLRSSPRLDYPTSDVDSLDLTNDGTVLTITVRFLGMLGAVGALPEVYSELSADRIARGDAALHEFLDIFVRRFLQTLYDAWRRIHAITQFEDERAHHGRNRYREFISVLLGHYVKDSQHILLGHAALLSRKPVSSSALESVLTALTNAAVSIKQFVGQWHILPSDRRLTLASAKQNSALGEGTVLGDAVWQPNKGAVIRVGPLRLEHFLLLLPGTAMFDEIRSVVRFSADPSLGFQVELILSAADAFPVTLGDDRRNRLGMVTWLAADDLRLRHPSLVVDLFGPG